MLQRHFLLLGRGQGHMYPGHMYPGHMFMGHMFMGHMFMGGKMFIEEI